MKKYLILFLVLFLSEVLTAAGTGGINFRKMTLPEAVAAAKKENKLVFIHGFADWCGHCKTMSETVYTDSAVGAFYNANYVCLKIDFEKEGKELAKTLKANSFPALVFVNHDGRVVYRVKGERKKDQFIQMGKDAMDPEKQLLTFETKYKEGKATREETAEYFRMLDMAGIDNQKMVNAYLSKFSEEQLREPEQWYFIFKFLRDHRQPAAQGFIKDKKEFEKRYTSDSVNNKIQGIYMQDLMKRVQRIDTAGYEKLKQEIRNSGLDIADKICDYADLNSFRMKSKWPEYLAMAPSFISNHCMNDARRLNEVAQQFAERSNDSTQLSMAESWAKRSIELNDSYKNNMTLASVQIKLKKSQEAKTTAEHALELGKQSNVDVKQLHLLMEKIEKLELNNPGDSDDMNE